MSYYQKIRLEQKQKGLQRRLWDKHYKRHERADEPQDPWDDPLFDDPRDKEFDYYDL